MALRVEVAGFGICKTTVPYTNFVICVQQEKFEAWTVYRRFQSFLILRDQLISHHPAISPLPAIDPANFDLLYLEQVRQFLDRWLQSLTCNTYILRMQAMYQFLCIDANMPPPYLEIYWGNSFASQDGNNDGNGGDGSEDMEMNEMFENEDDDLHSSHHNNNDDDDETRDHIMETIFEFDGHSNTNHHHPLPPPPPNTIAINTQNVNINNGNNNINHRKSPKSPRNSQVKKRPSNPMINPAHLPNYQEDENDAKDGMDIQSLSYVQAEFIYDKKDDAVNNNNNSNNNNNGNNPFNNNNFNNNNNNGNNNFNNNNGNQASIPKRTISLEAFKIIKVIGKGSFGKVFLVRDKASGMLYAMKVLKKDYIKRKNQVEHTKTERSVLGNVRHPYIVGLNMAFQTADKLFFVLDYCSGGELFFHLGKVGRFPEDRSKFYAGQIILALEYVHKMGIIYRDLKPENVLLDQYGNVRLTDFGLSKEGVLDHSSGANSFCGTPEYIAPEVLLRQGHGRAVDWWSLGALLYEMITGLPPFYSRNRETMFEKIMRAELTFPNTVGDVSDF